MDKNKIAVSIFDKRAADYQNQFMDVSGYKKSLDYFCSLLSSESNVLELGCGPGNVTKYILDRYPDLKITGTDLSPEMIALASRNNPSASFHLFDCRNLGSISKRYNCIIVAFVLPYLSKKEALKLIHDAGTVLLPDGILYLSTMEGDNTFSSEKPSSDGADSMYVNYHESEYLLHEMKLVGFKAIKVFRQDYLQDGTVADIDLILVARLQKFSISPK